VPSQAVQTGQNGQFVFVVKQDATVEQRPITVAQRMADDVVIGKGLTPGETIVTEGQLRLEQGTRVQSSDPNGNVQSGSTQPWSDYAGQAEPANYALFPIYGFQLDLVSAPGLPVR
jgi:multidrug efflux system membrane fusion protein